ncbi:S28 family serine protease [Psychroserpens damuponensis]|uniref:S28 family serine protease n=1 Tax=Psychroserpens damuponensis TaxID=943936 RepID=UPI00058B1070|nr:S28 family serine protease [Psychroserpens damuponensis]
MKPTRIFYTLLLIISIVSCKSTQEVVATKPLPTTDISNFEKLKSIAHVSSVAKTKPTSHFNENYEIWFEQPVDYNDASKGTFKQRVFLGFENASLPVIVELRGYGIGSDRAGELAAHYKANQLTIEHRYFNNSRPEQIDWNTLTIENAAKDQTTIINAIREAMYPDAKFITTGISKGCQTTMAHRRFFPNNVDASVCYVGPLNYQREDPRVYQFLKNVSTQANRDKVEAFQKLCFKNRDTLLQMMTIEGTNKNMTWEFGVEKAIDYTILEYAFAFWQWGIPVTNIPSVDASVETIYKHLIDVVGYGFFEEKAVDDLQPYFWAALTQQGIYGYETAPFKTYLNTDSIYKFDWAFPEGITKDYDRTAMEGIKSYLDISAEKILFIYGEYDAWSATAVELTDTAKHRELYKFVKPKGDHRTRINSFSLENQKSIYNIIDGWIAN